MLELLFQGMIEWLYGLILETWQYFFSVFVTVLSVDFEYLKTNLPVIPEIMKVMLAAGWALLLGNLVFQAMKSMMTGLGFEGEDPKLLFTRSFVFSFLLVASPQICQLGLDMTARVIERLNAADAVNVQLVGAETFGELGAAWLLTIIINIILMFKVIRFLLEIVERYLVLAFLTICAPLAFGVGGSKNTADIFTGWCRMFASMCFMMVSNVICFKLLLSLLGNVPAGADIFLWIALVFGVVKLARKMDAIITRIGLNPAATGDGLGGRSLPGVLAYTVMRTMVTSAVKSAGTAAGKAESSGQSGKQTTAHNSVKGGTANYSSSSSHTSGKGAANQAKGTPKAGGAASGTAQGSQSRAANRPVTIIPDDREDAAMNGPGPTPGSTVGAGAQAGGDSKSAERKSSVPPGTVRSPSVVKQNGSMTGPQKGTSHPSSSALQGSNTTVQGERRTHTGSNTVNSAAGTVSTSHRAASGTSTVKSGNAGNASVTQSRPSSGNKSKNGLAGIASGATHISHGSSANGSTDTPGKASGTQTRFTNAPHGGTAGIGARSPSTKESSKADSPRPGTAGTPNAVSRHENRESHAGPAGTVDGTRSRISITPYSAQNHTTRSSAQVNQQSAVTSGSSSDTANPANGSSPSQSNPGMKETRFTHRTVSGAAGIGKPPTLNQSMEKGQAASRVARRSKGAAGTSAAQEPRPTPSSGTGTDGARKAPAASAAPQETRHIHPTGASAEIPGTGKSGAPARQESRSAQPTATAAAHAPARQESGTPHISGTRARSPHPVDSARQEPRPAHASVASAVSSPVQQESKPSIHGKSTATGTKPPIRHGTAGIAPPAATPSHKEKPERAPRREIEPEEPKPDSAGVSGEIEHAKEGDASE